MTGTTVNSYAAGMNPTVNPVPNTKGVAEKTQDFGDILNRTAQKTEQPREAFSKADNGKNGTQPKSKDTRPVSRQENPAGNDKAVTNTAADEKVSEVGKEPAGSAVLDEEPVDEMTAEEIAGALSRILEQIKEILGVTDEELLDSMESIGMQPFDLLDSANMTQLVTALAGEDSAISLVANEELYTALQDITEMVDAQVDSLLGETGLTEEELDAALRKLQELEDRNPENEVPAAEEQILPLENQADVEKVVPPKEPVVIKEDNTQTPKLEAFPENQPENPVAGDTKVQPQKEGRDTDKGNDSEPKNFGQDQNLFQKNLNEAVDNAGESLESYTSENTESIMRQLADMVKIVKNENLTEMELQLHPASLGTVNVSLTTKGGVVTAEFTTQNEAVKAAIEAQASQLRANLEEQGVRIEAIEVSVASHQMERNLDGNGQGRQQGEQEQKTDRIQGIRRGSINLNAFEDGEELIEEMQGADDATRIAMEMMAANGNTMDILA